jgi:hypothetical protein
MAVPPLVPVLPLLLLSLQVGEAMARLSAGCGAWRETTMHCIYTVVHRS